MEPHTCADTDGWAGADPIHAYLQSSDGNVMMEMMEMEHEKRLNEC